MFESKIGGMAWPETEGKVGVSEGQPLRTIAKSPLIYFVFVDVK